MPRKQNLDQPYFARKDRHRRSYAWAVYQDTVTGARRLAGSMSERTARRVARLMNEEHKRKLLWRERLTTLKRRDAARKARGETGHPVR